MVLHAFDIMVNHPVVYTEEPQELRKQFMALGNSVCQLFACRRQNKAAVLFIFQKLLAIEPLNHIRDAGLRNL